MQQLSINEIIRNIRDEKIFEATTSDGSFRIKINRYVPYCCTAIHHGAALRKSLKEKIALDDFDRWYEEDPHTGDFIESMPITLIGLDSRYEYDLNRKPEECVFDIAWGKKVWKSTLSPKERQLSVTKHANYYKVTHALIEKLEGLFGGSVVYDIHSYNHMRWDRNVPLFNIGCESIDLKKFGKCIDHWNNELSDISLTGIESKAAINDVFYGRGYNLEYINTNFKNTLVLATEIKKVYCNELTGADYPKVIKELQQKLKQAIINNAHYFSSLKTNWKAKSASHLLDKKIDPAIENVDKQLYRLLKNFELLAYVNPTNTAVEQRKFFKSKCTESPKFKYSPIKINPFELKQELSGLKTQDINDVSIRHLYESVINSFFDKIDLLASLNSRKFLYNSLRYFGRPSKIDLLNAQYVLLLPAIPSEPKRMPHLSMDEVVSTFSNALDDYGIKCKIEMSNRVISQIMVLNSKRTVLIRPDAKFTRREVNALIEHEIGVHMVTTQNSGQQHLKIFNLGLPVNTRTQEGLAILSEYLSGNFTLKRFKKIALRVVVTDMMCNGATFIDCYNYLVNQQQISTSDAYTIVTRIFRGGGFTKDYLYLSGFVRILKLWNSNTDLSPLLVGKTSLDFYDTIVEMIDREMIAKPQFITKSIEKPFEYEQNGIYDYIISGLK
jgi:uncharacterized protein (TIGR02421 family)